MELTYNRALPDTWRLGRGKEKTKKKTFMHK